MARRKKTDAEYQSEIEKAEKRLKDLKAARKREAEIRKGEINAIIIQRLHEWNDKRPVPTNWEDIPDEVISMLEAQDRYQSRKTEHVSHLKPKFSDADSDGGTDNGISASDGNNLIL